METPQWEHTLWAELDAMTREDAFTASGEWTTHITRRLLTDLAHYRRNCVLTALSGEDEDTGTFADKVGSRRATIERLAMEGRKLQHEVPVA